jgi:hypothetical protein
MPALSGVALFLQKLGVFIFLSMSQGVTDAVT